MLFNIPIIRFNKPILPKNIKNITTYLLLSDKWGVIPIESPTVPKAENASKAICNKVKLGLNINSNKIPIPIQAKEIDIIAKARLTDSEDILLVPISICFLLRAIAKILSVANANVEVLIPPPVDAGEAPTHIKKIINKTPGIVKLFISTVLNPAVLEVMDENMAVVNFPNAVSCSNRLVCCSEKRKNVAPVKIKIRVV